jgi:hypothetical protein
MRTSETKSFFHSLAHPITSFSTDAGGKNFLCFSLFATTPRKTFFLSLNELHRHPPPDAEDVYGSCECAFARWVDVVIGKRSDTSFHADIIASMITTSITVNIPLLNGSESHHHLPFEGDRKLKCIKLPSRPN